jgi:hypothetical protein
MPGAGRPGGTRPDTHPTWEDTAADPDDGKMGRAE